MKLGGVYVSRTEWWHREPLREWLRCHHWLLLQPSVRMGRPPRWAAWPVVRRFTDTDWGEHYGGWRAWIGPVRFWSRPRNTLARPAWGDE